MPNPDAPNPDAPNPFAPGTEALDRYWAVRRSVALTRADHVSALRISGEEAFEALDQQCSADLYLLDGKMCHTFLLDDEAKPVADVYVGRDDEDYLLLSEGLESEAIASRILSYEGDVSVEALDATHGRLQLDGPYAWELTSDLVGPEVPSLPYSTFMHVEGGLCFRGGKTGEYGYLLLLEREQAEATFAACVERGERYDLRTVDLETLDRCALENGFFSIREHAPRGATPIELQQQWRVSYRKRYVGSTTLEQRYEQGPRFRSTAILSSAPLRRGAKVSLDDSTIGEVYAATYSPGRDQWVGMAALDPRYAYPGVDQYLIENEDGLAPITTHSLPLLQNHSLSVDPRRHAYATRDELVLPPLVIEVGL